MLPGLILTSVNVLPVHSDPSLAATLKPTVPDFKTAIDHFGIHAGGRAVIDAIQVRTLFMRLNS